MTIPLADSMDPGTHEARVLAWRHARVARLVAPDSWLSLVGKFWLRPGDNTAGGNDACDVILPHDKAPAAIGIFRLETNSVCFLPAPGVEITLRRTGETALAPVVGPAALKTDLNGAPDQLIVAPHALSCEIMQRESGFAVRVRDRDSPARTGFSGIDYFPIRHDLRVVARFVTYPTPKTIELAYETGASEHNQALGYAEFELDGQPCRVDPVLEGNGARLLLVFADPTNRDSSYGAGRFLYASLPEDGQLVLDFNQAFSPPCAFTPYALCPLPPPQNRLPVRIEAGEKRPREHAADDQAG